MKQFRCLIIALVLTAECTCGAIAGTAFNGQIPPAPQAEKTSPASSSAGSHEVYGTVRSIKGSQLTLQTRTGVLTQVDAAAAMKVHLSVVPVVGHALDVRGTTDKKGMLHAQTILRAKDSPAGWPADR
jgi:hypothetical protein